MRAGGGRALAAFLSYAVLINISVENSAFK